MVEQVIVIIASNAITPALIGLACLISFRMCRFLDVTLIVPFILAPYVSHVLVAAAPGIGYLAHLAGMLFAVLPVVLLHATLFKKLEERDSPPLIELIAALGTYMVAVNLVGIFFGDGVMTLERYGAATTLELRGATTSPIQIVFLLILLLSVGTLDSLLRWSRWGLEYRAATDAMELAEVVGLRLWRLRILAVVLGAALVGLAGVYTAMDSYIEPTAGLGALLNGVVVMTVAGKTYLWSVLPVALALAGLQHLSAAAIGGEWNAVLTFAVLALALVIRPDGLGMIARDRVG